MKITCTESEKIMLIFAVGDSEKYCPFETINCPVEGKPTKLDCENCFERNVKWKITDK